MTDKTKLGFWVRRFLLEYLVGERNLSRNTLESYHQTLRMLVPFIAKQVRKNVDELIVDDLSAEQLRLFLAYLEETRGCKIRTRNQRLAAVRSFTSFVKDEAPEYVPWYGQLRKIRSKRGMKRAITYLEQPEMDALLASPDRSTDQGERDYALLLFLYTTGAWADEAAQLTIGNLDLARARKRYHSSVEICGKGNKIRRCPLLADTVSVLAIAIGDRPSQEHVFLNRYGQPITRFGIHAMVVRHAKRVSEKMPEMIRKRVSPHVIRHTTATHLLRSGVDINTIRGWLGHVSIDTTNIYAEVDLEMKAKALAVFDIKGTKGKKPWREDKGIMSFLDSL